MKIVNERSLKSATFSNMKLGTVFIDEDGDVLMKIREDNDEAKAVSLATGKVFDIFEDYEGDVVEAILTIK